MQKIKDALASEQLTLLQTIRSILANRYSKEFLQELKEQGLSKAIINSLVRFDCGGLWEVALMPESQEDTDVCLRLAELAWDKLEAEMSTIQGTLDSYSHNLVHCVVRIKDSTIREKVLAALCGVKPGNKAARLVFQSQ